MHEVLVNRLGGLSLPRKSVVRLNDRPDMTLDVYRGRDQQNNNNNNIGRSIMIIDDLTFLSLFQQYFSQTDEEVVI